MLLSSNWRTFQSGAQCLGSGTEPWEYCLLLKPLYLGRILFPSNQEHNASGVELNFGVSYVLLVSVIKNDHPECSKENDNYQKKNRNLKPWFLGRMVFHFFGNKSEIAEAPLRYPILKCSQSRLLGSARQERILGHFPSCKKSASLSEWQVPPPYRYTV